MESSNPVFNPKTLFKLRDLVREDDQTMTVPGSINKAGFLILLTMASSVVGWTYADSPFGAALGLASFVIGLILCLTIVFKKNLAPTLAPIYAISEGLLLGMITFGFNMRYPGIAVNALILTFSVIVLMMALYHFKIVRVTQRFQSIMMVAMLGIFVTYMVDLAMSLFGHPVAFIHEGSPFGIIFSLVVVGVASMSLILDFDMIEKAAAARAPRFMEWYAGFAVLVTVVWLYMEILRLLSKTSSRR